MVADPNSLDHKPLVNRERALSIINADHAPDPNDEGNDFDDEPIQIGRHLGQTSTPEEAAAPGAVAADSGDASSPPPVEPPPAPPPQQYNFENEYKETLGLVKTLVQRDQEREALQREQWQRQQQAQRQEQQQAYDPDEYVQRGHLDPIAQRMGEMDQALRFAIQETNQLRHSQMGNEFDNVVNRFRNSPEYPDFDKYVPKAVLDNAMHGVRKAINEGHRFAPGQLDWQGLIESHYKQNAYVDLFNEKKQRAADDAKRAEQAKQLDAVGGTPRSGTSFQKPAPPAASDGSRLGETGFRQRIADFVRGAGYGA